MAEPTVWRRLWTTDFFEKLFHGRSIYPQRFLANLLRGNRRWNIFFFIFRPRQIFAKLFHGSFCQKCAEKKSPKKFFFFIFQPGIRTRALRPISQQTTYNATATFGVYFLHFGRVELEVVRSKMYKVYTERTALYSFNFVTLLVTSITQAEVWIRRTHGMFSRNARK